ncbi:MAG: aminotransferase class IV, partial [Propionicimonas sp.]
DSHTFSARSAHAWDNPGEAVLKLVLTRGRESVATAPFGYLTLTSVPDYGIARRGVTAVTLDRGHRSDTFTDAPWLLGGVKTLSYAVNVAARREAAARGVDEVVWRSSDGYLLEGPTSGLVFAADDRLWTTPTAGTGILDSVTVAAVFDVARRNGVDTGEALFTPAQARRCDGVWLVSAIRGVLPVTELDGDPLNHDPAVTSVLAVAGGFPPID